LGKDKHWNLKKLLTSHESAHVIFTVCTQASVGAFFMLVLGDWLGVDAIVGLKSTSAYLPLLFLLSAVSTLGLFKLNMHLGKPHRFYRGFNNLRLSPVSREIAGVSLFYTGLLGMTAFSIFDNSLFNLFANVFALIGLVGGAVGTYYMYKLYRIPARPFWNHWQTGTAFVGTALSFGGLLMAVTSAVMLPLALPETQNLLQTLAVVIALGLVVEGIGHIAHAKDMHGAEHEGAVSHYVQTTEYGKSYLLRNGLLGANAAIALIIAMTGISTWAAWLIGIPFLVSMLVMAAFGRSLFFVLVIPTTMPGAFFWKNKGFVEHAREIGLADSPQHGVAYERHHEFKLDELLKTFQENSVADMVKHALWILGKK
jgi:DMSO reductase anchor subunit